jgi:hypothetical protein
MGIYVPGVSKLKEPDCLCKLLISHKFRLLFPGNGNAQYYVSNTAMHAAIPCWGDSMMVISGQALQDYFFSRSLISVRRT